MFNLFLYPQSHDHASASMNPQCNLSTLVPVSFKLMHQSSTYFFKVFVAILIFPYFQFSPHLWSEVTIPTNTMYLWHVLWESDIALVIAHFWIYHLCVIPGNWNNFYLRCSVKDISGDVHLYHCICMCMCEWKCLFVCS